MPPFMCCLASLVIISCQSVKDRKGPVPTKDHAVFWTDGVQEDSSEARAMRGNSFLRRNASAEGVRKHRSGMQSLIMREGDGPFPGMNDIVTVSYSLRTIDGTLLDDSSDSDGPAQFRMTDVIEGWREALIEMRTGSEWRLFVPPHLAYGNEGLAQVQGSQTLIYDLKLVGVREDSKVTEGRRIRLLKRIKADKVRRSQGKGKGPGPGLILDNLDLIE
jgi:FKBP-type peptidyl-prolyl cis-trans isomerase